MSITAIQDALDSLISTTHADYEKLSDATDPSDNPNLYLAKGFATSIGAGVREQKELCNGIYISRSFSIILTNIYNPNLDASERKSLEQAIISDQADILLALNSNRTLSGTCIDAVYDNDNGIEYIVDEKYQKQYIGVVTDITVQYIERV